jgi:hypothetical protein
MSSASGDDDLDGLIRDLEEGKHVALSTENK